MKTLYIKRRIYQTLSLSDICQVGGNDELSTKNEKISFTNSQFLKFASVDRRAKTLIRNPSAVKSVKEIVDKKVLSILVLKILRHKFDRNVLEQ